MNTDVDETAPAADLDAAAPAEPTRAEKRAALAEARTAPRSVLSARTGTRSASAPEELAEVEELTEIETAPETEAEPESEPESEAETESGEDSSEAPDSPSADSADQAA